MADQAEPETSQWDGDSLKTAGDHAVTPDAFISYASHNTAVATNLVEALERAGLNCWIAPRDVRAGALYADAIVRAISSARALLLVLSESAIDSSHVSKEIERASSKKRPIIVLRIDAAPLTPALEYFLSESQWVEARTGATPEVYDKLIDAIRGLAPTAAGAAPFTRPAASARAISQDPSKSKFTRILTAVAVALVLGYLLVGKFWLSSRPDPQQSSVTVTPAADPPAPAPPAATPISEKSIAVLAFSDMSEKRDQEYFSDGLSEELIDLLARTQGLQVIARTSSFYFKGKQVTITEIAKTLNVAHVLEGSVRKAGSTVRITAQLIRAKDGVQLWSESYDRNVKDVFKVQDEISAAVVAALKVQLLATAATADAGRTVNTEAHNQYLLGRQFYNRKTRDGFQRAVECYRKAIELDPDYAAAYAGLSEAEYLLAEFTRYGARLPHGLAAADKAIALAPNLADGYAARAQVRNAYLFDFIGARADIEKAVAINPGDSHIQTQYALVLNTVNRSADAELALRKAIEVDPLSIEAWQYLGAVQMSRGQFAPARVSIERALDIDPGNGFTLTYLAQLDLLQARIPDALAAAGKIGFESQRLLILATAEHTRGHSRESDKALRELAATYAHEAAYQVAEAYAWRGEQGKAYEWLERSYQQRDGGLVFVETDPFFQRLRGDEEFKAFLRKMKLPE